MRRDDYDTMFNQPARNSRYRIRRAICAVCTHTRTSWTSFSILILDTRLVLRTKKLLRSRKQAVVVVDSSSSSSSIPYSFY